jgi:hypothetical protein
MYTGLVETIRRTLNSQDNLSTPDKKTDDHPHEADAPSPDNSNGDKDGTSNVGPIGASRITGWAVCSVVSLPKRGSTHCALTSIPTSINYLR